MKKDYVFRLKIITAVVSAVLFSVLMIWLSVGIDRAQSVSAEQRLENVRQSVMDGAVLCYSTEGFFPESIDYLKENYGLAFDSEKYLVHYRYVSADIKPSVLVVERDAAK